MQSNLMISAGVNVSLQLIKLQRLPFPSASLLFERCGGKRCEQKKSYFHASNLT